MSQQMRKIGNAVDKIGWRHFTEGKLPLSLKLLQHQHLLSQHTQITIDIWMKGLIDQLLTLTHTQWICRNLTKHHKTMGTKALTARDEIQKEVEKQLSTGFSDLPSTSRCLLEISPEQLFGMGTSEKQYWLNAAEAARTSANNALHISEGQSNSWVEIMKTPTYKASNPCLRYHQTIYRKSIATHPTSLPKHLTNLLRHPNDEERSHRATRQPSLAQQAASQIALNYIML
jgi:hypothetical protein